MVTPAAGIAGSLVIWYLMYMLVQTVWSFRVEGRRSRSTGSPPPGLDGLPDRADSAGVDPGFGDDPGLSAFSWTSGTMRNVSPLREGGGLAHALVGTLLQVGMAAVIAVPLSILVAIYLVEYGRGKLATFVTFFVDVMTGVPSIVAGLFIYTFWVLTFGFRALRVAASLALTILMIPVIVRSTEEMLKIVPNDLREASYALGVPKWKTIVRIVILTAFGGIVTGVMLSIARGR